jgi:hypothetical protein
LTRQKPNGYNLITNERIVKALLNVIDVINETLEEHPFVKTVTYGDIFDVDLSKQTLFPLSHYIVSQVTYSDQIWLVEISLLTMDIPADETRHTTTMAEQMSVIGKLCEVLQRGDLRDEKYHLQNDPVLVPFKDRDINGLYGWETTLLIEVPNEMPV